MPQFQSPQNLWPPQSGQSKPDPQYPPQQPQQSIYPQWPSYPPPMQQPPKKHTVRNIGWGSMVALIVLIVIIAAASNDGSRTSASNSARSPSPSTSRQQSTPGPQPTVAANHMGESVVVDSTWTVTVNSVKTSKGDRTFTPNSDDLYIIVDVTVKNTSSSSQDVASVGNFTIKDSTGEPYEESFTDVGHPPDGTIGAGKRLLGQLVYEVPSSQHTFTFMFQSDFTGTHISQWTLHV